MLRNSKIPRTFCIRYCNFDTALIHKKSFQRHQAKEQANISSQSMGKIIQISISAVALDIARAGLLFVKHG